jgi:tetratricopeptide (TPR) repeat protein
LQLWLYEEAAQAFRNGAEEATRRQNVLVLAQCLEGLSGAYLNEGMSDKALPLANKALELTQKQRASNVADYIFALRKAGLVHMQAGRFSEAEDLYSKALELGKKSNIVDTLDSASILLCLGDINRRKKQAAKAEECYDEAARIYTKLEGTKSLHLAAVQSRLALLRISENKPVEATSCISNFLDICRHTTRQSLYKRPLEADVLNKELMVLALGIIPPGTGGSAEQLKPLIEMRLDYLGKAANICSQAETAVEKEAGPNSVEVIPYLLCLAKLYSLEEKRVASREVYRHVLSVLRINGLTRTQASTLVSCADEYGSEPKTQETLLQQAVSIREKYLSAEDDKERLYAVLCSLGSLYKDFQLWNSAILSYRRAAELTEMDTNSQAYMELKSLLMCCLRYGELSKLLKMELAKTAVDSPAYGYLLKELGKCELEQRHYESARRYFDQYRNLLGNHNGADSAEVIELQLNLIELSLAEKNMIEARRLIEETLSSPAKNSNHRAYAVVLQKTAESCLKFGMNEDGIAYLQKLCSFCEQHFGSSGNEFGACLNALAVTYWRLGWKDKALINFQKAKAIFGRLSPPPAFFLRNLALFEQDNRNFSLAESLFKDVAIVSQQQGSFASESSEQSQLDLARLHIEQKNFDMAEAELRKALYLSSVPLVMNAPKFPDQAIIKELICVYELQGKRQDKENLLSEQTRLLSVIPMDESDYSNGPQQACSEIAYQYPIRIKEGRFEVSLSSLASNIDVVSYP